MGYSTSTIKRSRAKKLNASKGAIAVSLARKKDDPLYKRMIRFKQLYKQNKTQLEKKYQSKARSIAMQRASGYRREHKNLKLYQLFLSEQEVKELISLALDITKRLAEHEKEKIRDSCDLKFSLSLRNRKSTIEKHICHLSGELKYTQIIINGIKQKITSCKNRICRDDLKSSFLKAKEDAITIKNKIISLQQEIENS